MAWLRGDLEQMDLHTVDHPVALQSDNTRTGHSISTTPSSILSCVGTFVAVGGHVHTMSLVRCKSTSHDEPEDPPTMTGLAES